MKRMMFLAALAACGGGEKKKVDQPILPPDQAAQEKAPSAPPPVEKPAETAPPKPLPPADVALPLGDSTIKLVNAGKGSKAKLVYAPKADAKQHLEVQMDFHAKQDTQDDISPSVVLVGDATVSAGVSRFTVTDTSAKARDGAKLPPAQVAEALHSLVSMTLSNQAAANGTSKELALHIEKPDNMTSSALQLVGLAWPELIPVPSEPIGVGAKWEVTTKTHFAEKLEITRVTTYELKDHKGAAWTIASTTKITGPDQELEGAGAKATDVGGAGAATITLTDGQVYPTALDTKGDTHFTVSNGTQKMVIAMETATTITSK